MGILTEFVGGKSQVFKKKRYICKLKNEESKMKKVLILVAALFVGLQANAQLQVEGGYQHFFEQTQIQVGNTKNISESGWDGLFVGARYNVNLPWVSGLSVLPGLNFSFMFNKPEGANNASCREIALNIPVDIAYTYRVSSSVKLRGFTGPDFQIGLLNHAVVSGGNSTYSYNLYASTEYLNAARTRLNVSWGFGAGVVVNDKFTAHVRYELGMVNLSTAQYTKLFRNTLQIGVGYIF